MDVRLFQKHESAVLMQALNDLWAKNHILSRDERLLNHMFGDNPVVQRVFGEKHYGFLGAWLGQEIVGLFGLMAFDFNLYGKHYFGFAPTNWIVAPEQRHTGAGLKLMRAMMSYNPAVVLNLGINSNVARLYKGMGGYQVIPDVPRWIGVYDYEQTSQRLLNGNAHAIRYFDTIRKRQQRTNYRVTASFDADRWDKFHTQWSVQYVGFSRNSAFIKWRYINHPTFDYRIFTCEDQSGNFKGLLVIRIESILEPEVKIGRIVEFIAADQDSAVQLANQIVGICEQEMLLFVDFYCFSSMTTWGLETIGFKRAFKNDADKWVLPTRFQPLDLDVTYMMGALYTSKELQGKIPSANDHTWYITKGDADQDRPN
ncbi:hypothetical protein [Paenibacillus pabuli]|uniref:hypothetical protein n=1 Tax=Paenibacillus pabuli TaxID=1472 RepID=UPI0007847FC4|nr:hypothetical protein [Paenibacillus pabuli]MEC0129069.1 hypothetical protein [Paenibacillus pabuli]